MELQTSTQYEAEAVSQRNISFQPQILQRWLHTTADIPLQHTLS